MIFTEWYNESWAILLLILGIFGLIALGVFLLRKFILNKNSSEEVDLEKAADENLSRILEEVEDPETQISLKDAQKIDKTKEIGDTFDTEVTPENFGRVATSTAKQVVVQKIREAERTSLIEEFENKQGELVSGIVSLEDEGNSPVFSGSFFSISSNAVFTSGSNSL